MRLHDWYKCEHCPEFHPVEFDKYVKVSATLDVFKGYQIAVEANQPLPYQRYSLLKCILETSGSPQLICRYFQELDETQESFKRWVNKGPSSPEEKEQHLRTSQLFEGLYHVVKCIKANQRACLGEWKKSYEGPPLDKNCQLHVELLTSEPCQQWMEVTDFKVHVKPLWFSESRVYQFVTRISRHNINPHDHVRFYCMMLFDGKFKQILTFDHHFSEYMYNWTINPDEIRKKLAQTNPDKTRIKHSKAFLLTLQASEFENVFTELRLCYYANSEEPRVWIRSPGVTETVLPTTTIDLAPIYSSGADSTIDDFFGVKKLETQFGSDGAKRIIGIMDQKIETVIDPMLVQQQRVQNELMDRLERLYK